MNPDDAFRLALRITAGLALGLFMLGGASGWGAYKVALRLALRETGKGLRRDL